MIFSITPHDYRITFRIFFDLMLGTIFSTNMSLLPIYLVFQADKIHINNSVTLNNFTCKYYVVGFQKIVFQIAS